MFRVHPQMNNYQYGLRNSFRSATASISKASGRGAAAAAASAISQSRENILTDDRITTHL